MIFLIVRDKMSFD